MFLIEVRLGLKCRLIKKVQKREQLSRPVQPYARGAMVPDVRCVPEMGISIRIRTDRTPKYRQGRYMRMVVVQRTGGGESPG